MAEQHRPISPPLPPEPAHAIDSPSTTTSHPRASVESLPSTPLLQQQAHSVARSEETKPSKSSRPGVVASRAASAVHQPQPQPITEAVNTAFDQSTSTNQLDPELVRQVTEQVIKNLQAANLGGPPSIASSSSQQPRQDAPTNYSTSPTQRSPLQSSLDSLPPRSTPPSPRASRFTRDRHDSPERAPSDTGSWDEISESQTSTHSNVETTPRGVPHADLPQGLKRSRTVAADGTIPLTAAARERRKSSGADSKIFSKGSDSGYFESTRRGLQQSPIDNEAEETTTLEKIWQPLFDNGNPTMRLSQFLRGLAQHLIDDYEPRKSLVISPAKMLRFFDETKAAEEHYPWRTIFGGKICSNSISLMYRKLACQHHFTQAQFHEAPVIPALTPQGFETFVTCLIQAHPDTEFERLIKAVREMPISNADDSKERFPKELSRRLLPQQGNVQAEQRLISSLNHEPTLIRLERGATAMPPPPPPPPASAPRLNSFLERERNPYSQTNQTSNAVDDDDLTPPSLPIERERKPYYAREGTGKRYDTDADRERERDERDNAQQSREPSRPTPSKYRPEHAGNGSTRNTSAGPPQAAYAKSGVSDPMNIPNRRGRLSTGPPPPPPPMASSYGKSSSRRSPPRGGFARSEPMDINNIPQSQNSSNLHGPPPRDRFPPDLDDDTGRYSRRPERSSTFANEDEINGRHVPTRNAPSGGPPISSFSGRSGSGAAGSDQRRQSWFTGAQSGMPPPGAGTDGYGSYAQPQGTYGSSGQY